MDMLHYYLALNDLAEVPIVDKSIRNLFFSKASESDFDSPPLSFRTMEETLASIAKLKENCHE